MSCVPCHVSCVTCHLSHLTPTATDPPPGNSPTMYSRLVWEDSKAQKVQNPKNHQNSLKINVFQLTNISDKLFDQKSPDHRKSGFLGGDNIKQTNIANYRLFLMIIMMPLKRCVAKKKKLFEGHLKKGGQKQFLMSGPWLSLAKLQPLLFSAPRWRCCFFIFSSCNIKFPR